MFWPEDIFIYCCKCYLATPVRLGFFFFMLSLFLTLFQRAQTRILCVSAATRFLSGFPVLQFERLSWHLPLFWVAFILDKPPAKTSIVTEGESDLGEQCQAEWLHPPPKFLMSAVSLMLAPTEREELCTLLSLVRYMVLKTSTYHHWPADSFSVKLLLLARICCVLI